MPRRKNLDLASELGEDVDVTEEQAAQASEIIAPAPPPVMAPPVMAASQPITLTLEQLQALMASKPSESNTDLVSAFTKAIENSREPIPENKFSPGISVYNVLGEKDYPRPGLKCEMTLGTQDPKTKIVQSTYPFEADDLTLQEQIALNTLEPWTGVLKRLDEEDMRVSLVPTYNPITEALDKLTIVVPQEVTAKGSQYKNMLPSITNLVEQITGRNYAKLSIEDLKWFQAEHRAKRYVAVRETVAA